VKCDFSKEGVLRPTKAMSPCDKEASQFLLAVWRGVSPWTEGRTSPPKLIARCADHMIVGAADRQEPGLCLLTAVSEQEAVVFKTHEE